MTIDEMNRLIPERWMSMPEEARFAICGGLYEAEKAILESLALSTFSAGEVREFVFYHMHGYPMPEGARRT